MCHTGGSEASVVLVPRHRRDVRSRARRGMGPPVAVPGQDGLRFFPPPHTRTAIGGPASRPCGRSETGFPRATRVTRTGAGRSGRRERGGSMRGDGRHPLPAPVPLWRKPLRRCGVALCTTCSARAPVCPIPSSSPPRRRRRAQTPGPRGAGGKRGPVGRVSAGLGQRVPWLPDHGGDGGGHPRVGPDSVPHHHPCARVSQPQLTAGGFQRFRRTAPPPAREHGGKPVV